MKRPIRIVIWVLVLAVVAAAAAWGLQRWREAQRPVLGFETVTVDRGSVVASVTAGGTLSALVTVEVGSQVSGRVVELHVDFNDPVVRGQPLAQIDRELFEADIGQQEANLAAAEARHREAQADAVFASRQAERFESLVAEGLIARADAESTRAAADAARARVVAARANVEQARASVRQARSNLEFTTIVSPVDGVVISREVDVGQTVAAALQAPILFTIAEDLRRMEVHTTVAEADVSALRDGMPVRFTVDAWPADEFRGTVRQVRNAAQVEANVVTYDAVIDVDNPELKLRPGMTANVVFIVQEADDVLRVPNLAMRVQPVEGMRCEPPADAAGAAGAPGSAPAGARPRCPPARRRKSTARSTTSSRN